MSFPKVTIGIPTFNGANKLVRAVHSALSQDYPDIEVLISDNASTDQTAQICASLAQSDRRVRYLRQPVNVGATANFRVVLRESRGHFFMWLADDDWIRPDYVSLLAKSLMADPRLAFATGTGLFEAGRGWPEVRNCHGDYSQDNPARRALAYFAEVTYNSAFYGLLRREPALQAALPNVLAGDWVFVSELLVQGASVSVPSAVIHRSHGGMGSSITGTVSSLGLPAWQARCATGVIAWNNASALFRALREKHNLVACSWAGVLAFALLFARRSALRSFFSALRRALKGVTHPRSGGF